MKIAILLIMCLCGASAWAAGSTPWPEHPRPDFRREPWLNLNGPWDFAFDPQDVGENKQWFIPDRHRFDKTIVVPFPWESRLSGIGDVDYQGVAWYSREVTIPDGKEWKGRDCWLVVGACDWEAKVWINGQPAAQHVGGYLPFSVNLSNFAKPGERATITIRVVDRTEPQQPTGKQIHWYTRTSGIWQTVYLEPRGRVFIRALRAFPDIKAGEVTYLISVSDQSFGRLTLRSPDGAFEPVQVTGPAAGDTVQATVRLREPKLWSPDSPTLYPVVCELTGTPDGPALDRVESYFGLREISVGPAPGRDYQYIYLNGKPIYLCGALHQSFHPDGIYQYPDDGVIRSDYEQCKRLGLNFLRIHIKVPVPRELYWADTLGVLIMQDMPNFWRHSDQARRWYQEMLEGAIARDFNHPAILAWCNFNETWGIGDGDYDADRQQWVAEMYRLAKRLDPTRLVEDNSPCRYDHVLTDINSWHFYINDYAQAREHVREVVEKTSPGSAFNYVGGHKQTGAPLINSEYGGISAGLGDQDVSWCFKHLTNELRRHGKIGGYVYTELSDIEWEHNGLLNYDRSPKEFGYEFWHPGFSVKDLNNADFVVIDAPPMVDLQPGRAREIPIQVSHFSDHEAKSLELRWRVDWLDRFGERHEGRWQSRPASWQPFAVVNQPPLSVSAGSPFTGVVGALLVELVDGPQILARNYVNLRVEGSAPRVEVLDARRVALRFQPGDFAAWEWAGGPPLAVFGGMPAGKACATGTGHVEYRVKPPEKLNLNDLAAVELIAEVSAKAGDERLDWPARKTPFDYPQTDGKKWPTDLRIRINGVEVHRSTLPDDPADARGALSHERQYHPGSHGWLVRATAAGDTLRQIIAARGSGGLLSVRFEVPADAAHRGGLAIFGEQLGRYPVDPTLILSWRAPHGEPAAFTSDQPHAVDRLADTLKMLIPTAERGGHTWRWTIDRPGDKWTDPTFDDGPWKTGRGGFGAAGTPNAVIGTPWSTPDIWLRTDVLIENPADILAAQWRIYHDEDVEIYLNGTKVLSRKGYVTSYIDVAWSPEARGALRSGRNVIAVHCRQTGGGQNVDVGLALLHRRPMP